MPLFTKTPIHVTQGQVFQALQAGGAFQLYCVEAGSTAGQALLLGLFDEQYRRQDVDGFWSPGKPMRTDLPSLPSNRIKLKVEADRERLFRTIEATVEGDWRKVFGRRQYLEDLLAKARSGTLRNELGANVEPLGNYQTIPSPPPLPRVTARGAPPVPARPVFLDELPKARAWLLHGVTGDASAYEHVLETYIRSDGLYPLGFDTKILREIWESLVPDAPDFRPVGLATPYPSSVGGMAVTKHVLGLLRTQAFPARGDVAWENWAVFTLAMVMAAQPFPDGNKRLARAAYSIVVLSANIPFRAPTNKFGARLASML